MPTLAQFGRGLSRQLAPILQENGIKRVFVVSDQGVKKAGLLDGPLKSMQAAGMELDIFDQIRANAPAPQIAEVSAQAHSFNPDAIVSIGGGSCIDSGKAVNILLANPAPISRYDGVNLVKNPGRLHIAVPTTAGTSSEMTVVAVISDEKNAKKMVLFGKNISASIALIDPELTYNLPAHITAATGMDALTHAIEAYVSTASSPLTDSIAPQAVSLIAGNLLSAYKDGNTEARDKIMLGCMLAGVCFSNAGLGLVHSLAQPMGGHCHVPHGLANAICIARVMAYSMPAVPEHKINVIASALGLADKVKNSSSAAQEICAALEELTRLLHIPTISQAGVDRNKISAMSADALKEISTPTTPRMPTLEEVEALYEDLFAQKERDLSLLRQPGEAAGLASRVRKH
jgi:alcohol dehydrogenase class IV